MISPFPANSPVRPEGMTIAVTVYDRRNYIVEAIRSALNQSCPVKVMVVEDCGPDHSIRELVAREFGAQVSYFRNPTNRGLFDNWNACLDYCRTPWISILHDDDLLEPDFVKAMVLLAQKAPGRALYFGNTGTLNHDGALRPAPNLSYPDGWQDIDLPAFADESAMLFPGQLINVAAAKSAGGFRAASYFTGDWDMWFRLAILFGAARTATQVSNNRTYYSEGRGTSRVERAGWKWALDNVQRKRNLALLRAEKGIQIPFDRLKLLRKSPIPSRTLLLHASNFSRRILRYNAWLFTHCPPPNWKYAFAQKLVRAFGPRFLRVASKLQLHKFMGS